MHLPKVKQLEVIRCLLKYKRMPSEYELWYDDVEDLESILQYMVTTYKNQPNELESFVYIESYCLPIAGLPASRIT